MASETAPIAVRQATAADAELLLSLIRELAVYEHLEHQVVATEDSLRESLFGSQSCADALIAELDGQPAGFALFFSSYSTFLGQQGIYLEDLYVKESLRGRGIGKRLLAEVARLAVERNCGRLEWSALDWNESAIGFYKKLGAEALDQWTGFRLTGDALRRVAASTVE